MGKGICGKRHKWEKAYMVKGIYNNNINKGILQSVAEKYSN